MNIFDIVRNAIGGMATGPKALGRALRYNSDDNASIEIDFFSHLTSAVPSDQLFNLINQKLSLWDYEASADWIGGTANNTTERRKRIYELLKVDGTLSALLDEKFPPNLSYEAPIVIAREHESWYDSARQARQSFYRDAYASYLRKHKKWDENQIRSLEESTRLVMERLSDPERDNIYPVKGLVVGYVQSGKTANFTGVVARAADAGYRLIIVLAGTLNILRAQTQRRIDRELIGRPFITADNEASYASDLENFIDHAGLPSEMGIFDWHRLTNSQGDYQRLKQGIQSLEFRRTDKTKSFNHPSNLHPESARLLIVKKVPAVLKKIAADLSEIKAKSRLADIPTLVIDDESDQASVNTKKPTQKEIEERTATNSAIVSLLQQLPRAQYVGYTATPFANVFIDPNNEENLFPRDFIISLPRPGNYMGVADFHDLDRPDKNVAGPNERSFVRDVRGDDDLPQNLQQAIDAFILTGALKLYRQDVRPDLVKNYRHHTMLVHSSHLTGDHKNMADKVDLILKDGGYLTGTAWKRLEKRWKDDFSSVCKERSDGYPVPKSFEEISRFFGECWNRLSSGPKPVLIVNGDANDNPDFESDNIWKIIVGGAKLSRGYTIEGLTISYYRRRAGAADALMQMGRWFGFRDGYRDLVRLYIGRAENVGPKGTIDLFAAFEAVCRDEMEFRSELRRYAKPENGKPILPIQIPPLVPSHLLRPTASNKMYNAVITFQNFGGAWKEPTRATAKDDEIKFNQKLMGEMLVRPLKKGALSITLKDSKIISHPAQWEILTPQQIFAFLDSYKWIDNDKSVLSREISFLKTKANTCVDQWLFLCINGPKGAKPFELGKEKFLPYSRSRVGGSGERFGVYSESDHRPLVRFLCGLDDSIPNNDMTRDLRSSKQGIFVFYPVNDLSNNGASISMGFVLQFPENSIGTPISFGVKVKDRPDDVVYVKD